MQERLYSTLSSCPGVTTFVVAMAVISDLYFEMQKARPLARDLVLGEVTLLVEPVNNLGDALLDRLLVGLDGDLGVVGGLVRGRDASKLLDLTGAGLLVETLGVTLLSDLERHVDVDLDKGDGLVAALGGLGVQLTGDLAIGLVGGDEGGDGDGGGVSKELGDLGDAADVLVTVGLGKAKILVEAEADVVAVETVGGDAQVEEVLLESSGDGRLARSRETGQPDGETSLAAELVALTAGERRVPGDVAGRC